MQGDKDTFFKGTSKMNMDAKRVWEEGLIEEIKFWEEYTSTKGGQWKDEYEIRLDPKSVLQENLIIDRLHEIPTDTVSVLDVGAGPLTTLGKTYPGKVLSITAVDPLADEYNRLLDGANIVPPVRTQSCRGEHLLEQFKPECFDFAYARNSVDHTYDPLLVIENMFAVVNKGRFVLLRHKRNEAKNAHYQGLHQWNFDMRERDFILWNQSVEYDITQVFSRRAQVEISLDDTWIVCVLRKAG